MRAFNDDDNLDMVSRGSIVPPLGVDNKILGVYKSLQRILRRPIGGV